MSRFVYPAITGARGLQYWSRFSNLWAGRQKFARLDFSNEWRYSFGPPYPPDRSVPLRKVIPSRPGDPLRIILLGDTGEGDRSQYGLLPLIRALAPDMLIINGDVAYPAGRAGTWRRDEDDFLHGFFEPYRDLRVPVWATPGNHEYYSPHHGREFYDIFCTRRFDRHWADYGLIHRHLQPGMYWELDDLHNSGLVILGLDTGKDGNLDGRNHGWQVWKRRLYADTRQLEWFESRLRRVQAYRHGRALVLFHVPALTREREVEPSLRELHRVIARYPCIKLVLCAHDHNHQQYSPEVFRKYLSTLTDRLDPDVRPHYIVNGGGGGYLEGTGYSRGPYPGIRFPSAAEWQKIASKARQVVGRLGRDKGLLSRLMGAVEQDIFMDIDEPAFLSFLLLEIGPVRTGAGGAPPVGPACQGRGGEVRMTPVFMRALSSLYQDSERDITRVLVQKGEPLPGRDAVERCLQNREDPELGRQDLSIVV